MSYLVIFQEVPDNLKIFSLEGLSDGDAEKLEACHNKYVNGETWAESEWLLGFLEDKEPVYCDYQNPNHKQHKPGILQLSLQDAKIIVTGFLL